MILTRANDGTWNHGTHSSNPPNIPVAAPVAVARCTAHPAVVTSFRLSGVSRGVAIDRLLLSLFMTTALLAAPVAARAESGASSTAPVVAEPPPVSSPPPPLEAARGTVRPSKQVTLLARLDGVVKAVAIEEGDSVSEGQLLVQLDDAVQTARVAAAKAAADSSADVKSGALDVQEKGAVSRAPRRPKDAAATDWELRVARHGMAQARAKLQAAEERHTLDALRLHQEEALADQYRLLAPFAGRVTRVEVKPGATVTKDTKLLTVVALEELEAVLFLPVAWFGALEVGKTYSLSADEPVNGALDAVLDAVEPIIDPGSRTVRCVFTIQNPAGEAARRLCRESRTAALTITPVARSRACAPAPPRSRASACRTRRASRSQAACAVRITAVAITAGRAPAASRGMRAAKCASSAAPRFTTSSSRLA